VLLLLFLLTTWLLQVAVVGVLHGPLGVVVAVPVAIEDLLLKL
jgi:hypothetical protein